MKALLIDDEQRSLESLSLLIRNYCMDVEILQLCTSIDMAQRQIDMLQPDIVFLDVDMPPDTGFDLLRRYEELPFDVIFVTAFDHYAIEAIKFSALYYLLKPVKIDDLRDAVRKAQLRLLKGEQVKTNYFHANPLLPRSDTRRLVINGKTGTDIVDLDHIVYIEANNTYSTFHLKEGKKITSTRNIGEYEQMLHNKGFFRVHKSYIVNTVYVLSIDKKQGDFVILEGNRKVPLAIRRKEAFLSCL